MASAPDIHCLSMSNKRDNTGSRLVSIGYKDETVLDDVYSLVIHQSYYPYNIVITLTKGRQLSGFSIQTYFIITLPYYSNHKL